MSQWIGLRGCFIASGLITLFSAMIVMVGVIEVRERQAGTRPSVLDDLKQAAVNTRLMRIYGLILLVSTSAMILEPLLAIYVVELGGSINHALLSSGIVFSAVGIATVIMGHVGEGSGGESVMKKHFLSVCWAEASAIFFSSVFITLWASAFCVSVTDCFFAAVYPALNALIINYADDEFRGRAVSLSQTASQFGIVIGPLAGGILGGWIGIQFIFLLTGLTLIGAAWTIKAIFSKQPDRTLTG